VSAPVLTTRNLIAGYNDMPVVRQLSLEVAPGEIVALFGPNGAGKTAALLTIAGLLPPLGGTVEIMGRPVDTRRPHRMAQRGLAFVPDDRALVTTLSVQANLELANSPRSWEPDAIYNLFPRLAERRTVRAGDLSGGEQQMLAVGRALLSKPAVLVIDEMSMGLAPVIAAQLLETVAQMAEKHRMGVLMVEQHVALALGVADRVYVLVHGELALHAPADVLKEQPQVLAEAYLGSSVAARSLSS
jgi:branched-chain amino acid transport system ATP-binding protein